VFLALTASLLIVFGSPYAGEIRSALQSAAPEYYRSIVVGIVAASAVIAIISAVVQLRRVPRPSTTGETSGRLPIGIRYGLIAAAVAIGAGYARTMRTGDREVDMVEAFHFVEYGLVAYLFYRAWRRRPDVSRVLLAACAGIAVGIADEWVQWMVPGRVGELHDVGLNAVAVVCGLLLSTAVYPPVSLALPRRRVSRVALGAAIGVLLVAVAGFVASVHLGYEVHDGQAVVFRSRYDAPELTAAARTRAARWDAVPPPRRGLSREDHYLTEGEWHVTRRNNAIGTGDWDAAWGENVILERFYAPVLDRLGHLSIEQKAGIERSLAGRARGPYISDAVPYPIYVVRRSIFWLVAVLISGTMIWFFARAASASEPLRVS
jgi:VanZ family protein